MEEGKNPFLHLQVLPCRPCYPVLRGPKVFPGTLLDQPLSPHFRLAAGGKPHTVPPMIRTCAAFFFTIAFLTSTSVRAVPPGYERVVIEPVKTSIYVGSVTLTTTPFQAGDSRYSATYRAKVFPYFFSSEHGSLWISFDEGDFARLERGELVNFTGRAENSDKEERRIEGRAVPATAKTGKIKVRVFVSKKIELIFNSNYRFE